MLYRQFCDDTGQGPAGKIADHADSITAEKREAFEEAGLQLRSLECIATVWTTPGISTERMTSLPRGVPAY